MTYNNIYIKNDNIRTIYGKKIIAKIEMLNIIIHQENVN